jgi:hypothetical protein
MTVDFHINIHVDTYIKSLIWQKVMGWKEELEWNGSPLIIWGACLLTSFLVADLLPQFP